MDLSVLLGLIGAITSISVGVILEGGNPAGVLHISSFIIVIPTAMLAAVVATDSKYVKAAFKEFLQEEGFEDKGSIILLCIL